MAADDAAYPKSGKDLFGRSHGEEQARLSAGLERTA